MFFGLTPQFLSYLISKTLMSDSIIETGVSAASPTLTSASVFVSSNQHLIFTIDDGGIEATVSVGSKKPVLEIAQHLL